MGKNQKIAYMTQETAFTCLNDKAPIWGGWSKFVAFQFTTQRTNHNISKTGFKYSKVSAKAATEKRT